METTFKTIRIETVNRVFSFADTTLKYVFEVISDVNPDEITGIFCD